MPAQEFFYRFAGVRLCRNCKVMTYFESTVKIERATYWWPCRQCQRITRHVVGPTHSRAQNRVGVERGPIPYRLDRYARRRKPGRWDG